MPSLKPVSELTWSEKVLIAVKLKDTSSFFATYFQNLSKFDTYKECYEYFNEVHFEVFGAEKFSSMSSFKRSLHYHQNKNKQ